MSDSREHVMRMRARGQRGVMGLLCLLEDDGDEQLLPCVWKGLLVFMAFFSFLAFGKCVWVPYGRYGDQRSVLSTLWLTSFKVPARLAWMIQEVPSVLVPLYLVLNVGGRYVGAFNPNIVLLGMFLLHYLNRCDAYYSLLGSRSLSDQFLGRVQV